MDRQSLHRLARSQLREGTSMTCSFSLLLLIIICNIVAHFSDISSKSHASSVTHHQHSTSAAPVWLVNQPPFFRHNVHDNKSIAIKVINDPTNITQFEDYCDYQLLRTTGVTDGENIDILEHYFWGVKNGIAIELGALDGSPGTRSMTFDLEYMFGWKRILIEGDPSYRDKLLRYSPHAFSANVAICEHHTTVHFVTVAYVGGIAEFMSPEFMKDYHPAVYQAGTPYGNVSSIDWEDLSKQGVSVKTVECLPLSVVLHRSQIKHVHFFILDVEGGELQVLKSINWNKVRFDVLCVETEPNQRPLGYAQHVTAYLEERGYRNASGQQGRNMWFTHRDFVPYKRPGLDGTCFNGARKADNANQRWKHRGKWPKFVKCATLPLNSSVVLT